MTDESSRIEGLDFLRGCAVMGILLANIVMFALPAPALFNPFTIGTQGPADLAAWTFNALLVDGKMRAIFAMLLGASILLVIESAEMNGRDGMRAHRNRMLWLLPIGLAHYILLWSGDILVSLALCGLIATWFVRLDTLGLIKVALALLLLVWLVDLSVVLPGFWLRSAALAPDAGAAALAAWRAYQDGLGIDSSTTVVAELALYQGSYGTILMDRLNRMPGFLSDQLLHAVPELLCYVAFGMAMLKGGFLAGQWQEAQYRATWRRAFLVGLLPMAGLCLWVLLARDPVAAQAMSFGWSVPLRLPIAVALAAFAMALATRAPDALPVRAIRAVGRLALSNYLLTSLVMTGLFYGYGAGLFGTPGRAALVPIVLVTWLAMAVWSLAWRQRFGQGPAERLWRRLARLGG